MNFLSSLGNFSGGAAQGLDNGANIAMRAQQIQQAQFALDQEKKNVAAQAIAFQGMTGGQQGGGAGMQPQNPATQGPDLSQLPGGQIGPQPMAPGAPSQPNQPQAAPPQPPLQQSPQAALAPPPSPAGGPSPSAAPPSGSQPGGGAPASTSQIDPTDPMAGVKVVEMIARQIKAANPNADPQSLLLATQRVIDMSKGMAPALRAGAQVVVQQLRDATTERGQDIRADTAKAGQDVTVRGQDVRADTAKRGQDISLTRAGMMANAAMNRMSALQDRLDARFNAGQGNTAAFKAQSERLKGLQAELTAATRKLTSLKDATGQPLPEEDPRMQAVNKQIEGINHKMELLESAAGGGVNTVTPPAGGTAPKQGASSATGPRPTATNAKGEKMEYDGTNWVPVQKSGATK